MARRAPLVARGGCAGRRSDRRERRLGSVGFGEEEDAEERAAAARTDEARGVIEKVAGDLPSALARPGAGRAGI